MVGMGMGRTGLGTDTNKMMSALGLEFGKFSSEFANLQVPLGGMLQSLQNAFQAAGAGPGPLAGGFGELNAGSLTSLIVRVAYLAVLKEAMDKATNTKLFNVETAINDLWTHLDSVKKLGSAPATAASGGAGGATELGKLAGMIEKRQQMFRALSEMMRKYDDTARAMTSNIR